MVQKKNQTIYSGKKMKAMVESSVYIWREWYGKTFYEGILLHPNGFWTSGKRKWIGKGTIIWRCGHKHQTSNEAKHCSDDAIFRLSIDDEPGKVN